MIYRLQTLGEFQWLAQAARAPRIRSIREFAEQEIVIPEGLQEGTRYRVATMPWQGLWLDAIDSGRWRRFVLTACVQGGKTLVGWVIPILWHLFEWKENFGAGVPTILQAGDKWKLELQPVINANPRFRELVPEHGDGSEGGKFEAMTFTHGPTLKFLSGGGGDEKRSSITLRGSAVTEADRLDESGEASREAAPIFQIEARSLSFEDLARFYAECTSTTATGFVTREREAGTDTRPYAQCPHCRNYVSPEREHLVRWDVAENAKEAGRLATWCCPACGVVLSDADREAMARSPVAVHRGQTIDKRGRIHGPDPETDTFGLRVNCFWNLRWSTRFIAEEEWKAKHNRDAESAERKQRQWFWTLPIEADVFEVTPLEAEEVLGTQVELLKRGDVPAGTFHMSGAADLRKTQLHFVVIAWLLDAAGQASGHVVDVGVIPVESAKYGTRKALLLALRELRKRVENGYLEVGGTKRWRPGWFPIDGFYFPAVVRYFVKECHRLGIKRYIPSYGRGLSAEKGRGRYQHPTKITAKKPHIGDQFYIVWHEKYALHAMIVNADAWKTFVQEGFKTPQGEPGSLSTFEGVTEDELKLLQQFAKEVTAEHEQERIIPEKGLVRVWVNESRRPNHMGDAMYNACAGGHLCGVRFGEVSLVATAAAATSRTDTTPLTTPDGRAYFITARED